ncbi:MAG TPA: M48 family metallopeptidase [Candidatus Limnocylindria bacterium]|nr:M48 family metallopeptidase [Candidatus Limnocylindria bacterium]
MSSEPTPARLSIYEAAAANRWRTIALIASFTALIAVLAYFVGEYFTPGGGVAALPLAFALSTGGALTSYFAGDKLILAQSQARELRPGEEQQLHNIVETLAIGLGIPTPKLYVIEDSAPNAFATGRDPQHASVAVTRGLLDKLDRTELEGVLAHELSHVGNHDIRVMVLVTVLVGTVALLADWMWRSMFWGRGRSRDRGGGSAIIAVIAIALAALTPIIATLIKLAVSRQREYLADASVALLTRYPPGLVSALRRIAADKEALEVANKATASLYFANPLKDAPAFFDHLFDTHPPIQERIKRLEAM